MMKFLEDGNNEVTTTEAGMTQNPKELFSVVGEEKQETEKIDENNVLLFGIEESISKKAFLKQNTAGKAGSKVVAAKGKQVLPKPAGGKKVVVRKRAATMAAKVAGKAAGLKPAAKK